MVNKHQYLHSSLKVLCWRYGLFYLGLMWVMMGSEYSVWHVTLWYWVVSCVLLVLEYRGTYFLISDGKLIALASFIHGRDIPLVKIKKLGVGTSPVELFHPEGLQLDYENTKGGDDSVVLVFGRFDPKEIIKFVTDLTALNPEILVEEDLKKWMLKNSTP